MRKRLDVLLVERGLAESRAQAQALVMAGLVPGYEKAGQQVDESAELVVESPPRFVSRGGEKLAHALDELGVEVAGRDALDVGASTGGFTDVLLQRGAARVIALDVGHGQLHQRLRDDARVTVLERTNARELESAAVSRPTSSPATSRSSASAPRCRLRSRSPARAGRRSCSSSRSSKPVATTSARAGRARPGGAPAGAARGRRSRLSRWAAATVGVVDSGLPGPKGNREFFLHLVHREDPTLPDELDDWIDDAAR